MCYECHGWMLDHLTKEHADARCDSRDDFLFELEVQVGRCQRHVETCFERFREHFRFNRPVRDVRVYFTKTEVDIMRRSGGAALYSGAPETTADSNLHFATYRLDKKDRKGDPVSCSAVDHLFGYFAAVLQHGRVGTRSCCCFTEREIGLRRMRPVRQETKTASTADEGPGDSSAKGPGSDANEEPFCGVDCHTVESKIPGVQLMHDSNETPDTPPLAVRFLPEIEERLFWLNSQRNVNIAIKQRIEEPHVPVTLSAAEREELQAVAQVMIDQLREDKGLVDKIIHDKLGIYGWKSKKWTPSRATRQLEMLRQTYAPKYRFEAGIKLEPSKRGKAPRLLVADGDRGQVMAWVIIGTLESWLFKRWRHRSIKGLPKTEAMGRVAGVLRQKDPRSVDGPDVPVAIVENDGSAWDACMSDTLRDLVENPLMDAVADMVAGYFLTECPPDFAEARLASNKLQELVLGFRKNKGSEDREGVCDLPKTKCWRTVIRAIRRSGCRGTSCLNFLANMVCWSWAIGGKEACKLVRPQGSRVLCVDGCVRFVKMAFEGDDSILSFLKQTAIGADATEQLSEEFMHRLSERWVKMGHRPKLYWRKPDQVAEFTGWHFHVTQEGVDVATAAPDLFRNLTNMAFSINSAAVCAAASGDNRALLGAVAPGIVARLYPMADKFPMLCRLLAGQFGRHLRDVASTELTRDEVYALELEPEDLGFRESDYTTDMDLVIERTTHRFAPILERFEMKLGEGDPAAEADLAVRLGLVEDTDLYYDLLDVIEGGYRVGADSEAFRTAVAAIRNGKSE